MSVDVLCVFSHRKLTQRSASLKGKKESGCDLCHARLPPSRSSGYILVPGEAATPTAAQLSAQHQFTRLHMHASSAPHLLLICSSAPPGERGLKPLHNTTSVYTSAHACLICSSSAPHLLLICSSSAPHLLLMCSSSAPHLLLICSSSAPQPLQEREA